MCQRGEIAMILQNEFKNNGYEDILVGDVANQCEINLSDIFEQSQKPKELLGIFISKERDELFLLLDGNHQEINSLCDYWDDRIRVFTIINGKSKVISKLKYNIVQLIIYSGNAPDKSREGNLQMSRKIIIKGHMIDENQIEINDDEVIELPFHMISADEFVPDKGQVNRLRQLIPEEKNLLELMEKKRIKTIKKERNGVFDKTFKVQEYEMIKEWLEKC